MSGRSPRWISPTNGSRVGKLPVGSTIKLNLGGTPWDWLVVNQGLPSEIYDESCNGTWALLKNCYAKRGWNNTASNKLESSTIKTYLSGEFQNLFDDDMKSVIKWVKIPYRSGGGSDGTDLSGASGLYVNCFLLSVRETGADGPPMLDTRPDDGTVLEYFDGAANSERVAEYNGSTTAWYTRSPSTNSTSQVWFVSTGGGIAHGGSATDVTGIRPAIILPPEFRISADLITYPAA